MFVLLYSNLKDHGASTITVLSNSDPLNEKSVNVALETVLEFDPKSLEHDVKLIDNMQDFLAKVKGALNKTRKHEEAEAHDSRRNMRVRLSFTEFLERALRELVQFDDWLLESFVDTFHAEARRYHYKGCKFQELMQAPATRAAVSSALHLMTSHTPQQLKQILSTWHNKFKMENFTENERDLFDFLNNLYKTNDSRSMTRALEHLEDYGDQSITNVTREQIAKTIREALRTLIFDHYSSLDYNVRKNLNLRIEKFFRKLDSDVSSFELDQAYETSEKNNQENESSVMLDTTTKGVLRQSNNEEIRNRDLIKALGDKVREIVDLVTVLPKNKQLKSKHTEEFGTETKATENAEQKEVSQENLTKESTKTTLIKEAIIIKNAKPHKKHKITTDTDSSSRIPNDIKNENESEQTNPILQILQRNLTPNKTGHHRSESRIITGNLKQSIRFHSKDLLKEGPLTSGHHSKSPVISTSSTKRKRQQKERPLKNAHHSESTEVSKSSTKRKHYYKDKPLKNTHHSESTEILKSSTKRKRQQKERPLKNAHHSESNEIFTSSTKRKHYYKETPLKNAHHSESTEVFTSSTKRKHYYKEKPLKNTHHSESTEISTSSTKRKPQQNVHQSESNVIFTSSTKRKHYYKEKPLKNAHHSESTVVFTSTTTKKRQHKERPLKNAHHSETPVISASVTKRKLQHRNRFEKILREAVTTSSSNKKYGLHKKQRVKNVTDEQTDVEDFIKISFVNNDNKHSEKDLLLIGETKLKKQKTKKKIHKTSNQRLKTTRQKNQIENLKQEESSRGLSIEFRNSGDWSIEGFENRNKSKTAFRALGSVPNKRGTKLENKYGNKKTYDELCANIANNLDNINEPNQELLIKRIWKLENELEAVKEKVARTAASFRKTNNNDNEENKSNILIINGRKFIALKDSTVTTTVTTKESNTVTLKTNKPEIISSVSKQHDQEDNKNVQQIKNGKYDLPIQRKVVSHGVTKINVTKNETTPINRTTPIKIATNKNDTNARRMINENKMRQKYMRPGRNKSSEDFYEYVSQAIKDSPNFLDELL